MTSFKMNSKLLAASILSLCCFSPEEVVALGKLKQNYMNVEEEPPVVVEPVFDDVVHAPPVMGTVTEEWAPPIYYKKPKYEIEKVPIYYKETVPVYHKGKHRHGHGGKFHGETHGGHMEHMQPYGGHMEHMQPYGGHMEHMQAYRGHMEHTHAYGGHTEHMQPYGGHMPPLVHPLSHPASALSSSAGLTGPHEDFLHPHPGVGPHIGELHPYVAPLNINDHPDTSPHDLAPHQMMYPNVGPEVVEMPPPVPAANAPHIRPFNYGSRPKYPTVQVPLSSPFEEEEEIEWVHAPFADDYDDDDETKYYMAEDHYQPRHVVVEQPSHSYVPVRCGLDKMCLRRL